MPVDDQKITEDYALYLGDCVEVLKFLPAERVHFSVYSPPFAHGGGGGLYTYSSSPKDFSNNITYEQFFENYSFLVEELHRATMPGRMTAVHCMDVPSGNSGTDSLTDFPGDIIRLHERLGWKYVARYAVWKEPFAVYIRTMQKNLRHCTVVDDASRCSCAAADYMLVFRRSGKNPVPVEHPTGLSDYVGARSVPARFLRFKDHPGKQTANKYSQWIWRQYASAFWDDIRIDRVLPYEAARDDDSEKHVHPLQLDVIERAVHLWSNPGETVLTPFMGVGSEVYGAVINGRRGVGIELKPSYYKQAVRNLEKDSEGKYRRVVSQPKMVTGREEEWADSGDDTETLLPTAGDAGPLLSRAVAAPNDGLDDDPMDDAQ